LLMFLIEAAVLTVVGGIVGVLLGYIVAYGFSYSSGWIFEIALSAFPIGLTMSILIGLLSGIYPAISASQLHPIAALRSE